MLRTVKVDATKGADRTFVSLPGATLQWVGVSGRTMLYTCSPCSMLYAPCPWPCALSLAPYAFLFTYLGPTTDLEARSSGTASSIIFRFFSGDWFHL